MNNNEKILNLLGLATRARMITLGQEFVLKEMQKRDALVFLASDAGNNIRKKIEDKAQTYNCMLITDFTSDEISQAMGKTNRSTVLVSDKGFIKKFTEYVNS